MLLKGEQFAVLLQKPLLPAYTLYGDDPLLPLEAADNLRAYARSQGFNERVVLTALSGFNWQSLNDSSSNRSLFGERQLIDLRIPSGKPGKEGIAALTRYCEIHGDNPDLCLLVSLPALDWKDEKAAWLGKLAQNGAVVKFKAPGLEQLPGWIAQRLKQQNQSSSPEGLRFIAERVEGNLLAAHQEIQKLGLLYPSGPLTLEQVREAILDVARYDVDILRNAFLQGDLARYTRTLEGLRSEGEAPTLILWALSEEIRALARIHAGIKAKKSIENLFREAHIWQPRQAAVRRALQHINHAHCLTLARECARIDRLIKGIGSGNVWEAFLRVGLLASQKPNR